MTITAAADGSALGNPGPAGWSWYVDDSCWRAGGWPHGTNNMGELMAVLDLFRSTAHLPEEHLRILCDSQYVINAVTKWMPGWKRKGWKKADGKPVMNVELLKQIDGELAGRDYSFEWVKGHAGHFLNEAADERARATATAYQAGRGSDSGPGFPGAGSAGAGQGTTPAGQPAAAQATAPLPARDTAPARAGAPAPSQATVPAARATDMLPAQEDLFSSLEDLTETGSGNRDIDAVVTLERELLQPDVRSEVGELNYLLHPDYREISVGGLLRERDAAITILAAHDSADQDADAGDDEDDDKDIIAAPVERAHGDPRFELLDAVKVGEGAVHVAYRLAGPGRATTVGSLWQREGNRWRLRFRQETPEN